MLLPGLQGPVAGRSGDEREAVAVLLDGLALPGLSRLLSRPDGPMPGPGGTTVQEMACRALGVPGAHEAGVSAGALSRLGVVGETDAHIWMRADPVHLRADMGRLVLIPADRLDITLDEAQRITDWLDAHEHFPGPYLEPLGAGCWTVRLESMPEIRTVAPSTARGEDAMVYLPRGPDAPAWHRRMNEIQMLLHECPVNLEREARGLAAVNSVWFWGPGPLPPPGDAGFDGVGADDEMVLGAARWAGVPGEMLPPQPERWCSALEGRWLLALDVLEGPARAADLAAWRDAVAELDEQWLMPLAQALSDRVVERLDLVAGPGAGITLSRRGLRRWWRRRSTLQSVLADLRRAAAAS